MIPRVDIRSNIREVVAELKRDVNQVVDAATVSALNRTMVTARAIASRELKKQYGALPIRVIKGQIRIKRASRKNLRAIMTFSARRIRLIRYGVFQTPRGIRGNGLPKNLIDQDGEAITREDLAQAFIRTSRTTRVPNVMKRVGRARYPLQIVLAPALSETLVEAGIGEAMAKAAIEQFERALRRDLVYRLSKGGPRG